MNKFDRLSGQGEYRYSIFTGPATLFKKRNEKGASEER
jgi:hypothetical protein